MINENNINIDNSMENFIKQKGNNYDLMSNPLFIQPEENRINIEELNSILNDIIESRRKEKTLTELYEELKQSMSYTTDTSEDWRIPVAPCRVHPKSPDIDFRHPFDRENYKNEEPLYGLPPFSDPVNNPVLNVRQEDSVPPLELPPVIINARYPSIKVVQHDSMGIDTSPIQYIGDYVNSEGYKQRLSGIYSNNFTSPISYDEMIDAAEKAKSKTLNIYEYKNNGNALKSLWYGLWGRPENTYAESGSNNLYSDSNTSYDGVMAIDLRDLQSPIDLEIAHEMGHFVDPYVYVANSRPGWEESYYPEEYRKIQDNKILNGVFNNFYEVLFSETYADLMAFRYDLYNKGIYDSRDTKAFTQEDLDAYKKAIGFNEKDRFQGYKGREKDLSKRIFYTFTDEDIIQLMNTVAVNDGKAVSNMV